MGHCTPPASMTPVLDLPPPTFKVLCAHAAELVMRYDTAIAILGFAESGGVYCWRPCWARHPGAVLALPDLMVAQLAANGLGGHKPGSVAPWRRAQRASVPNTLDMRQPPGGSTQGLSELL